MSTHNPPTWEEWVHFCFTRELGDYPGSVPYNDQLALVREQTFVDLEPVLLTAYLTRLFEDPSCIAEQYSNFKIHQAVQLIFSTESDWQSAAFGCKISPEQQAQYLRSITNLYTQLFDRVCGNRGSDPDADPRDSCELDGAVYMIWDMAVVMTSLVHTPHLTEPCMTLLQTVLRSCRTSACRVSALHGIGHMIQMGDKPVIVSRLRSMVDVFLDRSDVPGWLREYAIQAHAGQVL